MLAREILDKRSHEPFSASLGRQIDVLARPLAAKSREEAKILISQRQYQEAREGVDLALRLSPKDREASELLEQIGKLEADPNTANITGTWELPNGVTCVLTDEGTEIIGYKAGTLPKIIVSCLGEWKRKGDKLTGTFHVAFAAAPNQQTVGTVRATIKDAKTLEVFWHDTTKPVKSADGTLRWEGKGGGSWRKTGP